MAIQLEPVKTNTTWGSEAAKVNNNNQKIASAFAANDSAIYALNQRLENVGTPIERYKDEVATIAALEALPIEQNEKGDGRVVTADVNANGQSYTWVWDGSSWGRTPYTTLPADVALKGGVNKNLKQIQEDIVLQSVIMEQGTFSATSEAEADSDTAIRSPFLNYDTFSKLTIGEGFKFFSIRLWDKNKNYIGSGSGQGYIINNAKELVLPYKDDIGYFRFSVKREDESDISASVNVGLKVYTIKRFTHDLIEEIKESKDVVVYDVSALKFSGNILVGDGSLTTSSITNATDFIPCRGFDIVMATVLNATTEAIYGLAFYGKDKEFITAFPRMVGSVEIRSIYMGYNIPENAYYLRTAYYADTPDALPFKLELIKKGANYNYTRIKDISMINNSTVRGTTGELYQSSSINNTALEYIQVKGVSKVRLPMIAGDGLYVTSGIAFYDEHKQFISGFIRPYYKISPYFTICTYDVPKNAVYMRSTWYNDDYLENHQDHPEFFIDLIFNQNDSLGLLYNNSTQQNKAKSFHILGDFTKTYRYSYNGPTGNEMAILDTNYAYGLYDALLSDFPNMIEKTLLGYATNVDGTPHEGYPIYEYYIKRPKEPAYYSINIPLSNPPKILLLSGIHGNEKISVQTLYEFINNMLRNWKINSLLEDLLFNFEYRIIPLANPYGFDIHTRNNGRGVNINRNFEFNWENQEMSTSDNKGTAPLSELETQVVAEWFNTHNDALIQLDFHDTRYSNTSQMDNLITYIATSSDRPVSPYSSYLRKMSRIWIDKYSIDTDYRVMGRIGYTPIAATYSQAYYIANIKNSSIVEICRTLWNENYSKTACEISCEQVVNYLCALIDYELKIR